MFSNKVYTLWVPKLFFSAIKGNTTHKTLFYTIETKRKKIDPDRHSIKDISWALILTTMVLKIQLTIDESYLFTKLSADTLSRMKL